MSDNENAFDATESRTRKRMLPSVAEVARELSRRTAADAASILTISRKVCSEELIRVKEGLESVPVEVLVERARVLLEKEAPAAATPLGFEPPLPPPSFATAPPAPPLAEGADPFGETMGKLDLRWEGEAGEVPRGLGGEAPPGPPPFEMSFPLPAEAPGAEGPSGWDVPAVHPAASAPAAPFAFNLEEPFAAEPAPASSSAPFQPAPAPRSKLPLLLGAALAVVAIGGAAWFFMSRSSGPAAPPPPLAVRRKPAGGPATVAAPAVPAQGAGASADPSAVQPTPALPATPAWVQSDTKAPAAAVPAAAAPAAAAVPTVIPVPAAAPTAVPPQPTAVAQKKTLAKPRAANGSPPGAAPEPVPVEPRIVAVPAPAGQVSAPAPVPVKAAASPKKADRAPSATQEQTRAGSLVTPDWTAAPVFVIHFSSFQEKARTEKHAAVLAKQLGIPVRAVAVDLGEKGTWYRSVAGEFSTAEEALALRNQLLEKGTPGVGLVYRMSGKK